MISLETALQVYNWTCKLLTLPDNLGWTLVPTKVPDQIYPGLTVGRGESGINQPKLLYCWLKCTILTVLTVINCQLSAFVQSSPMVTTHLLKNCEKGESNIQSKTKWKNFYFIFYLVPAS